MRLKEKAKQLHRLKSIVDTMQYGSDEEAAELLARLRLGESVDELASHLERTRTSVPNESPEQETSDSRGEGYAL